MKKLLLFVFMVPLFSFAQKNDKGVLISEVNSEYIMISETGGPFDNYTYIEIDYGQAQKLSKNNKLIDITGKPIKFHSIIDALNYFHKNGYEYIDHITKNDTYFYLLKKQ